MKFLPEIRFKWVLSRSLASQALLLGSLAFAQTPGAQAAQTPQNTQPTAQQPTGQQPTQQPPSQTQPQSSPALPPPGSRAARIQEMLDRSQAARRRQAAQQAAQPPVNGQPAPAQPTPQIQNVSSPASSLPSAPTVVNSKQPPAAVKSVQIVHDKVGAAIEIMTSRPVPPALQTLPSPPRLVIDLPNANVAVKEKDKRIAGAQGEEFAAIRVDQFQVTPPVTRLVVDLRAANQYTWDAAGNRLMIRVKAAEPPKPQPAAAQPTTVSAFGMSSKAAVVPVTTNSSGSMVLAGSRIGNGSSVTATAETAVLHIARGGEVHVCPGTTVSVTASKGGPELMLGMSSGSLETHYHVAASADTVLTPDFRIMLAGPGDFDYAISSNSRGDTCVRALLGNTASAMVTELMGDRTYQVKPTEQVVFHEGRIDRLSNDVPADCGCPGTARPAVMLASNSPNPPITDANLSSNVRLASGPSPGFRATLDPMLGPLPSAARGGTSAPSGSQVNIASMGPETAPLPPAKPNDIHVQIVAPFTFRGTDPAPAPVTKAQNLPVKPANTTQAKLDPPVLPPPPVPAPRPPEGVAPDPPKKQHRGFFGRVKGFFSSAFK